MTEQYELENQIWKDIIGTNGIYQVSNLGRWRRMHKTRGPHYSIGGHVSGGYLQLEISLNHIIVRRVLMHDLVAETFIRPVDFSKEVVHHINQNTKDNRLENLKIETIEQHLSHHHQGFKHSQQSKKKIGEAGKGRKQTPESIAKRLQTQRKKKENNPDYRKHHKPHSQQTKKKIGQANKGRTSPRKGKKFGPMSQKAIAKRTATRAAKKAMDQNYGRKKNEN